MKDYETIPPKRCPEFGTDYGIYVEGQPFLLKLVGWIPFLNFLLTKKIKIKSIAWDNGPVHSVWIHTRLWRRGSGYHEMFVTTAFHIPVKHAKLIVCNGKDDADYVCVAEGHDFYPGIWSSVSFNYRYVDGKIIFEPRD